MVSVMTKEQLNGIFEAWAEKHRLYVYPNELDSAVSLLSFDSGYSEKEYSGTQIFAVAKQRRGKIHMFVFALQSTWSIENDFDDDACAGREVYRKVIAF